MAMEMCDDGYKEIVFEGEIWECPLCEANKKLTNSSLALKALLDEVMELKEKIEDLKKV